MVVYIIDSYAWVEYFLGSEKGEILRRLFSDERNEFLTVECCLAEIKGWALREELDFDRLLRIIKSNSGIEPISEYNWISAAQERFEQKKTQRDFGLIDSVILVKKKELKCKLVSGDKHFKGMKGVVFLG